MKRRLYIAYGSNLNLGQMANRCPTATVVGTTYINDYELVFRGGSNCAVATIEKKKGSRVPVTVWDIKDFDEKRLDAYEGYPRLYKKEDFKIELNGEKITAMAYVMTPGHELGVPSDYYYNVIYQGYEDNELDTEILEDALENTMKKIENKKSEEKHQFMKWW